jgi:hypothetical protein
MRNTWLSLASVLAISVVAACSGSKSNSGFDDPNGGGGAGSSGTNGFGSSGNGTPGAACVPDPKNAEIPGNNCDDDGDGKVDNPPVCDDAPGTGAEDFAKALGICTKASDKGYGLVSATFQQGFGGGAGNDAQHGVLPKFGNVIKPREGKSLGVLSTGYAQEFDGSPGESFGGQEIDTSGGIPSPIDHGKDWKETGTLPAGFPKAATGCQQSDQIHDPIEVKLVVKTPPNASGVKFDFNFYSGEWPAYICSPFNDGFIAYLSAKGFNSGKPDNMSFDKNNNPVSVNNGFFDRCTPSVDTGCAPQAKPGTSQCPGGTSELDGTGFGIVKKWCEAYSFDPFTGTSSKPGKDSTSGGATGWLTSQAPVQPGEEFTIEFILWDTGDGILDSSVLIDNFTWAAGKVDVSTSRPN